MRPCRVAGNAREVREGRPINNHGDGLRGAGVTVGRERVEGERGAGGDVRVEQHAQLSFLSWTDAVVMPAGNPVTAMLGRGPSGVTVIVAVPLSAVGSLISAALCLEAHNGGAER
jgi:hypothetical protein